MSWGLSALGLSVLGPNCPVVLFVRGLSVFGPKCLTIQSYPLYFVILFEKESGNQCLHFITITYILELILARTHVLRTEFSKISGLVVSPHCILFICETLCTDLLHIEIRIGLGHAGLLHWLDLHVVHTGTQIVS